MNRLKMWSDTHFRPDCDVIVPFDAAQMHERIDAVNRGYDALRESLIAQGEYSARVAEGVRGFLSQDPGESPLRHQANGSSSGQKFPSTLRLMATGCFLLFVFSVLFWMKKAAASEGNQGK